jgi:hypothetical protein
MKRYLQTNLSGHMVIIGVRITVSLMCGYINACMMTNPFYVRSRSLCNLKEQSEVSAFTNETDIYD